MLEDSSINPSVVPTFVFIIILFIKLGRWLGRRGEREAEREAERKSEQEKRDKAALEIAQQAERRSISGILSGGGIEPFALYLRPFTLEEMISDYRVFHERMNFDYSLQNWFGSLGTVLISLGAPNDDKEGAGHVFTADASWFERFRQLAEGARTIVVVPGTQPGIMSELRCLRELGLLEKTIFFKPKGYPKAEWRKLQELSKQGDGLFLPHYSSKKLSFRINSSGRCHSVAAWGTPHRKSTRERRDAQMRALLSHKQIDFKRKK